MKKRLTLWVAVIITVAAVLSLCGGSLASARPTEDPDSGTAGEITDNDIKKNGLYRILHACYTDGSLRTTISYKDKDIYSIAEGDGSIFSGTANKYMPTGFSDKDPIYCVSQKNSGKTGIINVLMTEAKNGSSAIGNIVAKDSASRTGYYRGMGYTASYSGGEESGTVSGEKCWELTATAGSGVTATSNKLCFTYNKDDVITSVKSSGSPTTNGDFEIALKAEYYGKEFGPSFNYGCENDYFCVYAVVSTGISDYPSPTSYDLVPASTDTKKQTKYSTAKELANMFVGSVGEGNMELPASFKVSMSETPGSSDGGSDGGGKSSVYDTYTISGGEAGYTAAYNYLEGGGGASSNKSFDNTELFYIYTSYLAKIYGLQVSYEDCEDTDASDGSTKMYIPVVAKDDSGKKVMKYCLVDNWTQKNAGNWQKVSVGASLENKKILPEKVVELLKSLAGSVTISRLPANQMSETTQGQTPEGEDPGEEGEDSKPSCTTNAHELGWIICPIVTGVSSFLKDFYEDWIEPFLNIDIGLFRFNGDASSTTDDSAAYSAGNIYSVWTTFQGFANLAFVIVFLVVIFSQLTGIGIDNYGIKKILPKLIVCAVLINLSYIICMLAVELSNIIGFAVKGLFTSVAPDVSGIKIRVNPATPSGEEIPGLGTNLAVIGIIAGLTIPYALSVGWAIIVPALILVLSVLLSLFFLFAMLGIRQALVIILVCLSPLAFVCYMLPNTKKLFDKWFNIFKAMLLAFPICSGLVYGGDLVAKILVASNQDASSFISSVGILFTAAIVSIAPVFMIPGMIRKGLDVAGGIGAKINGAHGRTKGMTDNRVKNAGWARDLENRRSNIQQFKDARRQRRKAGLKEDGTLSKRGERQNRFANSKVGSLFKGSNAALAKRRAAGLSQVASEMGDKRYMEEAGLAAATAGLIRKQENAEVEDEIINMEAETGNYHTDKMSELLTNNLNNGGDDLRMKALVKKLGDSPDGIRSLIKIAQSANGAGAKRLASYMTESGIAGKIGAKDTYVSQYMKDVQAGVNGAVDNAGNAVSFDQWANATHHQENGVNISNAQNISQNVLDKDEDLVGQSQASFERSFANMDQSQVADRARRMLDNENIRASLTQDKLDWLQQHAAPEKQAAPTVVNVDNYTHNGRGSRTARLTTYSDGTVRDESGREVNLKDWTRSVKRK